MQRWNYFNRFDIVMGMYYADKIKTLQDLFGTPDVEVTETLLRVGARQYPIREDVIELMESTSATSAFAPDIQYTFGEEWKTYSHVLPEHEWEFKQYFDVVGLA